MKGTRYNGTLPSRRAARAAENALAARWLECSIEPASLTGYSGNLAVHQFGSAPRRLGSFRPLVEQPSPVPICRPTPMASRSAPAAKAVDAIEMGDSQLMMDQIVFATDFSAASRKTLGYAAALARKTKARIIGVHALKPPSSLFAKPEEELKQWENQHLRRLEAFLKAPVVKGIPWEARLASGSPQRALKKLARQEKADLILVAKQSRSTLEKFFVGSSTERIVAEASCPVLVAPDLVSYTTDWNPVLCPIDFSRTSHMALEWAIRLCKEYQAGLTVLHVATLPEPEGEREAVLAKARREMDESLSLFNAPPGTQTAILEGKPSQQILLSAEKLKSDLVVMGRRGMNEGDYIGMGSTALAVLKGETFPLLIVPGNRGQ